MENKHSNFSKFNRTSQTEDIYLKRALNIAARFRSESGIDWQEEPFMFVGWLLDQRRELAKPSWRNYKAAVHYLLVSADLEHVAEYLAVQNNEACLHKGRYTSAHKQKGLPDKKLGPILDEILNSRKSKYGELLGLWLLAGRVTGLRPMEWFNARLDGDILCVKNAKYSNGRSHGDQRHLDLSQVDPQKFNYVKTFLELLTQHSKDSKPEDIYHACRKRMMGITKKLWPQHKRRPTLYSVRHQFAVDLKKSGMSFEEVAALFGHATDRTVNDHYGKKNAQGSGDCRGIKADPKEILRVKKVMDMDKKNLPYKVVTNAKHTSKK